MTETRRPHILVQLHGGLGNQLFQAAAGLALAERLGGRVGFDISRFRDKGLRGFALAALPTGAEVVAGGRPGLAARLLAKAGKLGGGAGIKRPAGFRGGIFVERQFHFDERFEAIAGDTLIAGFFQSPRYFVPAETRIRAAFDAGGAMSPTALRLGDGLDATETVAVHIRRGDYAGDEKARAVHGVLGDDYYERALALIRRAVPGARIKVFSDDAGVAGERAAAWGGEAVAGVSALEDLWLMSRCRHHVIANSSFSWWSAWLDRREDGLRIAPRQWFARDKLIATYTGDLFPEGWILV